MFRPAAVWWRMRQPQLLQEGVRHTGTLQAQMSPAECPLPAAEPHMAHGALKVQRSHSTMDLLSPAAACAPAVNDYRA